MLVKVADVDMAFEGPQLGCLRDANSLLDDSEALRARFEEDGYLLLRGLHSKEKIAAARQCILEYMNRQQPFKPEIALSEGRINLDKGPDGGFSGDLRVMSQYFSQQKAIQDIVKAPERLQFLERLLGGPVVGFDYQWLRLVGHNGFTHAHCDIVFMGLGTRNLYTVWTPFMDVPLEQGGLAICVGSHKWEKLRETYGAMDYCRDRTQGSFDPLPMEFVQRWGGQWQTTEFHAGDILLFGAYTLHASINNQTDRFRLSMDSRYQLASEPMDSRWVGDFPYTQEAASVDNMERIPINEARKSWGI